MREALRTTNLAGLTPFRQGKVRDIYDIDGCLLIVATDRLSAFDVVLPTGIPDKGKILTQLSLFWFDLIAEVVPNHLISAKVSEFPTGLRAFADQLEGRSMFVHKAEVLPVECVVRGYLAGSGWKDYAQTGGICGHALPPGLIESDRLPEPIFTPATKEETGHDQNVTREAVCDEVGAEMAEALEHLSLAVYQKAADYALERGVILCDTKLEFGLVEGRITLVDEVLTPDSSRFWDAEDYQPGHPQNSFDKQFVRDYLETLDWDKTYPGPELPLDIVEKTAAKYHEAYRRIVGHPLPEA